MADQTDYYQEIKKYFPIEDVDFRTCPPLTLAYIGDGVYDLVIRSIEVGESHAKVNTLHHQTSQLVKAQTQSEMIELLLPELSETEADFYRRGRNAKSATIAKNATVADYRRATGFEALMGYLYLSGQTGRMLALIKLGLEKIQAKEV
ncbi:MAG: ribonuclease III [Clostridiales bacterium]|nr:ribonuclease III [Clostridiales bacterium]